MSTFSLNDIITGEKLQSIADFCIIDNYNPNRFKFSKKSYIISKDKIPNPILNEIKKSKSIYIPTHHLNYFFNNIYPFIDSCILITHNSDHGILDHHTTNLNNKIIESLNSNKIKHWYSQNISLIHPKLTALPIGIANSMWPHGNLNQLFSIMKLNIPKTNLYYFNFHINTRKDRREPIYNQCIKNGFKPNPDTNQKQYLINIKKSKFCISPPGNGFDCHRLWEAIYLNCIPIVIDIPAYSQFKELPILFIKKWSILTPNFLELKYKEMKNKKYNYKKAKFGHYKNIIKI